VEEFLQAVGAVGLIFLVVVGALAGLFASAVTGGRNRPRNVAIGVLAAIATPFVLALVGVGLLAAGGLAAILAAAVIGAVVVLLIARAVFD
jgi:uncharacterized membrane protein YeaQ/YmgE (transglycosylase-associated protein family)